jgi:type II restriction enzyme
MKNFLNLVSTFADSIKNGTYYVDWDSVYLRRREYELILNKLNFLLWKSENFKSEFYFLLNEQPEVVQAFPILLATREKSIIFQSDWINTEFSFLRKRFITNSEIESYYQFFEQTGLIKLFTDFNLSNLVDYVFGVEVWLNSNARKNRSWQIMESLVQEFVIKFADSMWYSWRSQATAKWMNEHWWLHVHSDKSERRFDFAIYTGERLYLFETNFYGGGGSKLKAVAWEFSWLYHYLQNQGINLLWITDGLGWNTTLRPLEDAYNATNGNIYNLSMLRDGILEKLII